MRKKYYIKAEKKEKHFPIKFCEKCGKKIPDPNPQFTNYYNWDKRRYCSLKCRNIINMKKTKEREKDNKRNDCEKRFPQQQTWEIKKLKEINEVIEKRVNDKRR